MFWGLIMEPNKRYTQTVEKSFHVSMATLDISTANNEVVQVMLCYEGRNYLLCNLNKTSTWQVPLDLNFLEGMKIAFTCNGNGYVHLTGYQIRDEDLDDLEEEEEDDEENEIPQLVDKEIKRKAKESPIEEKRAKRIKQDMKTESSDDEDESAEEEENEDEEDSDMSDESVEGEEEDDKEEDSDEDEDDEEEAEEKSPQPQQSKKNKQAQQQQQQQQQQQKKKKKDDKQIVMNGKDAKQEPPSKQQKKTKEQQQNAQTEQKKKVVEGGVQIEDLKVGSGALAKTGKFISVYYVGRLKNGKKFDATTQGDGFKFRFGKGEVIKGWDIGIAGMKVGGKRRITVPPALAYGAKGSPPVIPGNSTLIFEVELRSVH